MNQKLCLELRRIALKAKLFSLKYKFGPVKFVTRDIHAGHVLRRK